MKNTLLPLLFVTALCGKTIAAPFQRVAYDDAGEATLQPHLIDGQDWVFKNAGDATPAARSCVFGSTIRFGYSSLKAGAAYKVRLTLFADEVRTMRVKAGQTVLGEAKAENGKTSTAEFDIPAAARQGADLNLTIEHITGPNAVVSEIEILSNDPAPLPALPEPALAIPHLSPQPQKVDGVALNTVDLGGMWQFSESLPADLPPPGPLDGRLWKKILVPGEWAMQGLDVKPGTPACYMRTFGIPDDWQGKRIKLRCDAVYSDAVVWVNGKEAGRHSGGFTPFELEVTGLVKYGRDLNTLALAVLNESVADKLASGSQYACHQLGGIPRGIRLMVLPKTHLSALQVTTTFEPAFRDATLGLALEAASEGDGLPGELVGNVSLTAPDGKVVEISPNRIAISSSSLTGSARIPVPQAVKWDNEHPMLYTLTIQLEAAGTPLETVTRKIGFRQIEVRGNELFVNGQPVKIRGSNHHEVYPTTGRSLPAGTHRRDVELFREGNVNLLRTCHYPPDEALMAAADELGMFIECEAPFCWAPGDGHMDLVCQQTAEMVLTYRNHPSVLWWSLANESQWGSHFVASSKLVRKLDPTRPQIFNDCGSPGDPKFTNLINFHYPGHGGPAAARNGCPQPVYHGEDTHLNAYNRLELATDPALRDSWGKYLRELWDDIQSTKGALGQSIWSGVDDTFYMPDDRTVGYGAWGPIDGWRRTKPEYWGMKKAYSPVRIAPPEIKDNLISLAVENRLNFSNMSEMRITWQCGDQSGTARADIAPGAKGVLPVTLEHAPNPGERLELSFADPRGFIADQFSLPLLEAIKVPPSAAASGSGSQWSYDKQTGDLTQGGKLTMSGPRLMVLPLNNAGETQMTGKTKVWTPFTDVCANWTSSMAADKPTVTAKCDGAEGSYTMVFHDGGVDISYDFTITRAVNPRQVGLVFTLPHDCETFSWERQGYWDAYPEDHIGRLQGTVKASEGFEATSVGPRTKPDHPWRLDNLPYGNNDFCSTKHNVTTASLTDVAGNGIRIDGQGKQHVRCWRTATAVNVLVADYSNAGAEGFLRGLAAKDDRPLKPGDKITGTVRLTLAAPTP
ncbi:MAG: glycoside hydrolase family 2 [Verrucomicrobia bacterium]|nr:glycoside hydrolase family 2 [Verrucomicrobiota bacterium]